MENQPNLKTLATLVGNVLAAAGVIFLLIKMYEYGPNVAYVLQDSRVIAWSLLLACFYCCANTPLALAWWQLLKHFEKTATRNAAIAIYGRSILGKYVPGNVMNVISRQALGMGRGLPGWALAKASFWELFCLASAGSVFIVLLAPEFGGGNINNSLIILLLLFIATVVSVLRYKSLACFANAFTLQIIFLAFSGAIFTLLLSALNVYSLDSIDSFLFCTGAFVTAWLAGFLTPGAPAGVGIREVVLTTLLTNSAPESQLFGAIILSRLITSVGDVGFFAIITYQDKKER